MGRWIPPRFRPGRASAPPLRPSLPALAEDRGEVLDVGFQEGLLRAEPRQLEPEQLAESPHARGLQLSHLVELLPEIGGEDRDLAEPGLLGGTHRLELAEQLGGAAIDTRQVLRLALPAPFPRPGVGR